MAKIPDEIKEIIHKFVEEASKDNIHISKAILFGSYANGTNTEWSDIDLAVVSEDFEGIKFYDSKKLNKAILNSSIDLELHTYRPEEFNADNPFVKEIFKTGISIV